MTTAASILSRVRNQLIDNGSTQHWTDAELLNWLSDGQRFIAAAVPAATASTTTLVTATGPTQNIPADGHTLITVNRNIGGPSIIPMAWETITTQIPSWTSASTSTTANAFIWQKDNPTVFYLYPPAQGQSIEIVYSVSPPDVATTAGTLTIKDLYIPPLVDYIMYRACAKDDDRADGVTSSDKYFQAAVTYLTVRATATGAT